jgi:hypothetical protein
MEESPNYYGILPASVRYCKGLTPNAKILYTELTALTNKNGYCHASNNYFAELYNVSDRSISQWFKELSKFGFIEIQIVKNNSGTFRKIFLTGMKESSNGGMKISSTPYEENFYTKEYYKEEYTSNNIINNNIDSFSKKEPKKVSDKKDNTTFIFSNDITSDLINSITSYFEYRKEIKKPFKSQKAIDAKISQFTQQAKEYGDQAVIQSISNAIANQYQGTFIDKQFLNKSQTQLIDDKGNYQKSDAGRKQFITDVTEGAVEAIRELRNRERDDYWIR